MTHTTTAQNPTHPAESGLASPLVAALEATWAAIQHRHPEIPDVVIVVAAGSVGVPRGALKLGHFAARRWTHAGPGTQRGPAVESGDAEQQVGMPEVFVGGEGLALGAVDVLGTLLHEATHALAHVRQVQDTSRQGRYHNRRFRNLAEEMGLFVAEAPGIGWSDTFVPEAARTDYAHVLDALSAAIRIHRRAEGTLVPATPGDQDGAAAPGPAGGTGGTASGAGSRNGAAARCGCGRRIRVTASVLALGPITCGICGQPFTIPDTPPTTGSTVDESDDDADDEADDAGPVEDEDTAGSVSRQHYIDTGHYLDSDGLCPCDEEGAA
ncbi:hypothetical protein [Kineosporia sp. R_H_3]|uniref:hypothetical protein n=1 Tax=Kineosporia sp. R_H_3 TaxID=1961848 RepID=UPI0018EA3180|nr:hypothetical protein [Kineosporia sp. R_H_3]